MRAEKRR